MRFLIVLIAGFILPACLFAAESSTPWEQRAEQERQWRSQGFNLIPHHPNYFFPFTYNTSPHAFASKRAQYKEAKFQISFKVLLAEYLFQSNSHLYFGYTQLSMWQVYDRSRSAPFRDVNYEPEILWAVDYRYDMGSFTLREIQYGVVHQSNGIEDPYSRSWNRIYAKFFIDRKGLSFTMKPWYRIPDARRRDDNRNIEKYMGYGEATVSYAWKNHILSVMMRNNLRAENKGAIRVDYNFPLTNILTGLVQYFNGYGESLSDYNRPNNRFSVGIALSDWH